MKLNIGGGYKRIDGYSNIDHDPLTNPEYCFNIETENWPFEDDTVEAIRAHHILEHIGEGFFHVLKEIYRICKDGTIIDIAVPHHRHENYYGDPTHRRPIAINMLRQFSKKYCEWHKEFHESSSGFAPRLNVDFEIADYSFSVDDDYQELVKEGKYEELDNLSKRFNNVYKDVFIKLLVVKNG